MSQNSSNIVPTEVGNTKQPPPAKHWCFTLNNYSEDEYSSIVQYFSKSNYKYIIGKEIGEEGTPHLQGYVELIKKTRMSGLKKINNRIHWEKCRNIDASIKYCSKENDFKTNIFIPPTIKFPIMNKNWELDILNLIKEEPDDRSIHWYIDNEGNSGKTTFTKYLAINHNAILCPSKSNDAFHRISKCFNENGIQKQEIKIIIFDIPRSSLDFINYGAIEKIKDGCVVSGKYEGMQCIYPCPHVIIFANEEPDIKQMSTDRWMIHNINEIKIDFIIDNE